MKGANTQLMRQFAAASLEASLSDEEAAVSRSLASWRTATEDAAVIDAAASASASSTEPVATELPTGGLSPREKSSAVDSASKQGVSVDDGSSGDAGTGVDGHSSNTRQEVEELDPGRLGEPDGLPPLA